MKKKQKTSKVGLSTKEKVKAIVPPVASRFKKQSVMAKTEEALSAVPKITNETVAEHREEVLKGARKYKYPLQHSKYKIIIITSILMGVALIVLFVGAMIGLYRNQATSNIAYRITQVVPFPVAKAGDHFISYENYLFELRRYMYYYRTQQQVDFSTDSGKRQLEGQKPKSLDKVIQKAYVKELAEDNKIRVSGAEVKDAVSMLKAQNMLRENKDLESVTKRFYNWSVGDLEREIRDELLAQKVAATLDTEANELASSIVAQLEGGADFAALAKEHSQDDATKEKGGEYESPVSVGSQEVSPVVVRELAKMKPGEFTEVIRTATSLEIVKLIEKMPDGKYKAAHIQINFKPIEVYTDPIAKKTKVHKFIDISDLEKPAE